MQVIPRLAPVLNSILTRAGLKLIATRGILGSPLLSESPLPDHAFDKPISSRLLRRACRTRAGCVHIFVSSLSVPRLALLLSDCLAMNARLRPKAFPAQNTRNSRPNTRRAYTYPVSLETHKPPPARPSFAHPRRLLRGLPPAPS
jgi:hypothetical protein